MRTIDLTAILLCIACGVLLALRAELGRRRMINYLDVPSPVRWLLLALALLFAGRALRIYQGFGEADASEVLVYGGIAAVVAVQAAIQIVQAWSGEVANVKADVIPEVKDAAREAVTEALPAWLTEVAPDPEPIRHRTGALIAYPPAEPKP